MVSQRQISRGEKDALKRLNAGDWRRVPGGYACPGVPRISLALAQSLQHSGLARSEIERGIPRLKITGLGRATLDGMKARAGDAA